ncbi:MAG: protoporphyrinogen oxidase [Deferribacterales bacterium]|nr:protoporphyrinogen oxidase [Deferribacterales bacterium]
MRVGIIGGGISGISLASKLCLMKKKGADLSVTLLEANSELGGTMKTVCKEGFVIESGSNGFLDSKPFTLETFKEAGLEGKLLRSNDNARIRFIQRYSKLHKIDTNPVKFLSSGLLTMKGKLRIACEMFVPQRKDGVDETLASFAKRRLGEEALDFMIGPMVSGVFAGDPTKMSLKSSFPVIANLESQYGGLIKGFIKKRNKKSGPAGPGGVLTAYENGMGQALEDLAETAAKNGAEIIKSSPVEKVEKVDGVYKVTVKGGKVYEFDRLAVTCPAYKSAEFLKPLSAELSETLASIPYSPMFVAGLGFHSEDVTDPIHGFGYLIPAKENRNILGALFTSSMFPDQAPEGKKLLRIMCGGDTEKGHELLKKTDEELLEICIDGVKDVLGVVGRPYVTQYFRHQMAIPQYHVGHSLKVAKIEEILSKTEGLYLGGNIMYGISLNDCTRVSGEIAEKIKQSL